MMMDFSAGCSNCWKGCSFTPDKVYNEIARLIGGTAITNVTVDAAKEMKILANKLKGE